MAKTSKVGLLVIDIEFVKLAHDFMSHYLYNMVFRLFRNLPKISVYTKANKLLRFLSGSSLRVNLNIAGSAYPAMAMKLSDFQRNAPIRGKNNIVNALNLLISHGRISLIDY